MGERDQAEESREREARERVERLVQRYLARGRYLLNPDRATSQYVLRGLTRNLLRYGRGYCPCRDVTGDAVRDRANLCPCPQHHADIARDGFCECGLFVSESYAAAQAVVGEPTAAPDSGEPRKET
jgi:ferredoxin-thioredoxin reductase catalytic chain